MRIAQLISQTVLGGAEICGFNLAAGFALRGHQLLLLANRRNGPLLERPHPSGMRVAALDRRGRIEPRVISFLARSMREFRPDVLHAHNFEAYTWARAVGLVFPRMTVVCHAHRSRMVAGQPLHRVWIDRVLFGRADAVVAVNDELRDYLRDRLHVAEEKLHVVANGIDTRHFAPPEPGTRDARHVLCVASLTEVKNHEMLLRAWARVRQSHPDAHLTLVGDGPLREPLLAQARASGTASSVSFAGIQTDVLPYLRRASVFALASRREAMPLSVLEAMATGLPCVAPAVGSLPALIQDGASGILVPPGDAEALARALDRLLVDAPFRESVGLRAREEIQRRFGTDAWLDRIEDIYRDALARRRDVKGAVKVPIS